MSDLIQPSFCVYCGDLAENHTCPGQRAASARNAAQAASTSRPATQQRSKRRGGVRFCRYCGKQLSDRSSLWKHEGGRDRDNAGAAVCQRQRSGGPSYAHSSRSESSESPSPSGTPLATPPSTPGPALVRTSPPCPPRYPTTRTSSDYRYSHPASSLPSIFSVKQAYTMPGAPYHQPHHPTAYASSVDSTYYAEPDSYYSGNDFADENALQLDFECGLEQQLDAFFHGQPQHSEMLLHQGVPPQVMAAGYY